MKGLLMLIHHLENLIPALLCLACGIGWFIADRRNWRRLRIAMSLITMILPWLWIVVVLDGVSAARERQKREHARALGEFFEQAVIAIDRGQVKPLRQELWSLGEQ